MVAKTSFVTLRNNAKVKGKGKVETEVQGSRP